MKSKIILSLFLMLIFKVSNAQSNTNPQAVQLAHKIAKKMKDSLDLSAQQRQQIYEVNMNLQNQKQDVRLQNPPRDSLIARIQRIETTRDGLYRPIIGEEKFTLYLQKKTNLVNNN